MRTGECRVAFVLSESEFVRAHRVHLRRSLLTFKNALALTFALGLGMVQAAIFGGEDWALRVFGLLWVMVIGFAAYSFVQLPRTLFRRQSRYSGPQEAVLASDGVRLRFQGGPEELRSWSELTETFEDHEFFFFRLRHGVPWIVPKRAFASPAEAARFRSFLESDAAVMP
ncbi:MAG: YcxB family protein [Oligoflexia bacterium]|nr:YcxB family protein [Oligoflexia bacterium]